jgi:subtilase-type serine protease
VINGVSHGGAGQDQVVLGGPTGVLDLTNFAANFTSFEETIMHASFWTLVGDGTIDLTVDQGVLNVISDVTGSLAASGKGNALLFVDALGSVRSGDKTPAVVLDGAGILVNGGIVDGAVTAPGGGSTVVNFGVIESTGGVAVAGGDGAQHVENHGVIVSDTDTAIDLGGGNDMIQMSTDSRVAGKVLGGTGFDTLSLTGGGAVRLDLAAVETFEMVRNQGDGLWMLTGSSSAALDVRSGTVVLNGLLTGSGSVQPGGVLAGNGAVAGLTNAGLVSPGMSLGRITVLGDYVQTTTGALQIEGAIVSGMSDRLHVTGTAVLGGTLELVPESRPFGIATEYTVLEAQGGVTGTFAAATATAAHLDTFVDYLPNSIAVALVRNDVSFAGMGDSANLQALGQSLDASKRSMARGDFKVVMDEFLTMDAPAQTSALRSLSGELHTSLPSTLLRTGERFLSASATRRLSAEQQGGERMTFWTDYLRFNGDVNGNAGLTGSTYAASGLVAGADFAVGSRARLGGSFGYANGTSELALATTDGARVRSRMPAVYGEYGLGRVLVEGAFGYAEHTVHTGRQIAVGPIRRHALADYVADQYSGTVRVSIAVPVRRALAVAPFFETRHSQVTRRAFDETGADSVNLSGDAFRTTSLRTLVGMRATFGAQRGFGRESSRGMFGTRLEPALSLAWTRDGQDRRSGMSAALAGMTSRPGFSAFTLNGASDSRHGVLIDAGTSLVIASHGRAFVAYDGLLTDLRTEHSFAAGMRIVW